MPDRSTQIIPTRLLRLIGLIAVVTGATRGGFSLMSHWPAFAVLVVLSWIGWAAWVVAPPPPRRVGTLCMLGMAVGGGFTAAWNGGSMITALAVVFSALSVLAEPLAIGAGIAAISAVGICASFVLDTHSLRSIAGALLGLAVVGLAGWSRRQSRIAADQNRLLLDQNRIIREERDRAAALAERGRIARDIHDVLAHTLGGLVLQLDAADALLEAGDTQRAAERVRASHRLAMSGLADARNVVGALRSDGVNLATELHRLAEDHRASGGHAELRSDTELRGLGEQTTVAVMRTVQEAFTNVRKHAPGQPVTLDLHKSGGELVVTVSNPLGSQLGALARSGAGAGLLGMTERIAAVGGTVDARKEDGRWTVRIRVPQA